MAQAIQQRRSLDSIPSPASRVEALAEGIYARMIEGNRHQSKTRESLAEEAFASAQAFVDYLEQREQKTK